MQLLAWWSSVELKTFIVSDTIHTTLLPKNPLLLEDSSIPPPEPIYSCPSCQHWIAEGVLSCPDCQMLTYTEHLNRIGAAASQAEQEKNYLQASALWRSALKWMPQDAEQAELIRRHIATLEDEQKAADNKQARWKKRLGPLFPLFIAAVKLKSFIFLAFKMKFLLGFLTYFALYWALFGWKFALGFIASILVHELGHYYAVRRRGLRADLPVLLPGLGAYVRWFNEGLPLSQLAAIALAGPLWGLGAALACMGLYLRAHHPLWEALTYTGSLINLANLIPVLWFDGAQATYALNRLGRGLILISCIVLFALMHEGIFLFLAAGMAWRMFTPDVPEENSVGTLAGYLALLIALGALMYFAPDPGAIRR